MVYTLRLSYREDSGMETTVRHGAGFLTPVLGSHKFKVTDLSLPYRHLYSKRYMVSSCGELTP